MAKKTLADIDVNNKTVLMRVDFNVPITDDGQVGDDRRIQMALPSIKHVLDGGGSLVLMSHLGRPGGDGFEQEYSLEPAAKRLGELLGKQVRLGDKNPGSDADVQAARNLQPVEVMLLENLRFDPGEKIADKAKKNPDKKLTEDQQAKQDDFTAKLARLGGVYVNDAFGTCHRKHVSMYTLPLAVKDAGGPAVAGFLVEKEIKYLHDAVSDPDRPFVAILGGAKVSDKIQLISTLLEKVDKILIGGAMAYTLLKAQGVPIGKSRVEEDQVDAMKEILGQAGDKIVLPVDHVVTDDFDSGEPETTADQAIGDGKMGMDIGPMSIEKFTEEIKAGKTIVWNGPMGVFEKPDYAHGTQAVAEAVAEATDAGATSVIGGGDSASAVGKMGLDDRMTHISTGGGASLTYLEGKPMPPIEVLDEK